jgi:hypothetical protein
MPTLTIRFIDEPGIVSRLISWTTNSEWCHTEALSRDGQAWIGARAGTGVQARPLDWCHPIRERRYAVPVTQEQYDAAMTWLEAKVGCPYDYRDIIGLALHRRIYAKQRVICSALMLLWLMEGAGLLPLNCLSSFAFLVTPETLHLSPIFIGKCVYSFPTT